MPVKVRKLKNGYRVREGKRIRAYRTTKKKAEAQSRLLRGIVHGWKPTGKKRKNK